MIARPVRLALAVALACLVHATAFAQGTTTKATLSGVVQDTSGAVVPGATVVVKNVATGISNETTSNGSGAFSVPALDAGSYEATVSLSGFKTVKIDKIVADPGRHGQRHREARGRRRLGDDHRQSPTAS